MVATSSFWYLFCEVFSDLRFCSTADVCFAASFPSAFEFAFYKGETVVLS